MVVMEELFCLIGELKEYIADLRNGFLSIDAIIKLNEKGKFAGETSLKMIKEEMVKIANLFEELRTMGF
jgi:hypothetical protein